MVERGLRDLEAIRRLMDSAKGALEAKEVKDLLRELGYTFQMSMYGVLTNVETKRSEYRRIEVLSDVLLSEREVNLIYRFMQHNHPVKTYSIWVYDSKKDAVRLMWECW